MSSIILWRPPVTKQPEEVRPDNSNYRQSGDIANAEVIVLVVLPRHDKTGTIDIV